MARTLTTPRGETFTFDAGAPCLDFAHAGGSGRWAAYEILHEPADLAAWLAEPPVAARPTRPVTIADLAAAKQLRDAIHEAAWAIAGGGRPAARDLAAINRAARAAPLVPQIDARTLERSWALPVEVGQALSSLARDTIDLFSGPDACRIRQCASDDCSLVFVDTSRPGSRRWCSMGRCGNRHKLRRFRRREG
ncbi:MAG TPA: ABATE domain-containing protein [Acidimicrobiia bacterium]